MYIELERDYTENDNKGLFVHMYSKDMDEAHTYKCGEDERCQECEKDELALVRIVDGGDMINNGNIITHNRRCMVWYEDSNPVYMFDVDDAVLTAENLEQIKAELRRMFPSASIEGFKHEQ